MKRIRQVMLLGVLVASTGLLTGCASRLLKVDPMTLKPPKKLLIVWTNDQKRIEYVREGQGLLEMLISEATKAPWIQNIETFDLSPVVVGEFDRLWKPELSARAINYEFVPNSVTLNVLQNSPSSPDKFKFDLRPLVATKNADYVVILQILSFKVVHNHYFTGLFSIPRPDVVFKYKLTVVKVDGNTIVGEGEGEQLTTMVDGWDVGPGYTGIYQTMVQTFSKGMTNIYTRVLE
ncbi:hypothetical protein EB093_07800 [bacterium]|nr:hypothetical protein [bacterium]